MSKLKQKPILPSGRTAVGSHSILYVCKECGWVGTYDELDLGEIGTYGYAQDPKCPRCKSNI
jgi:hypothetical protein